MLAELVRDFYFMIIENLNELETLALLQRIGEHLRKNNTEHLIDQVFDRDDLAGEIDGLKEEIESLKLKMSQASDKANQIIHILD